MFNSLLFATAAPISQEKEQPVVVAEGAARIRGSACPAITCSDVETMRRHACFMAADGNVVCAPDVSNGQNMIVAKRL